MKEIHVKNFILSCLGKDNKLIKNLQHRFQKYFISKHIQSYTIIKSIVKEILHYMGFFRYKNEK